MLAIVIYVIAAIAVVVIGLVTVGRETFAASQVARPALFEIDRAVEFVSAGLDDRTAARLTPDDVLCILQVDAELIVNTAGEHVATGVGVEILDNEAAVRRVMDRLDEAHRRVIEEADVVAVIAGRTRYLVQIGAIGAEVLDTIDDLGSGASSPTPENDSSHSRN